MFYIHSSISHLIDYLLLLTKLVITTVLIAFKPNSFWELYLVYLYTLSEALDRSTRTIVGTMLWIEYRPVMKIGPKGALGSHEMRPIHSVPSLGQSRAIIHKKDSGSTNHIKSLFSTSITSSNPSPKH